MSRLNPNGPQKGGLAGNGSAFLFPHRSKSIELVLTPCMPAVGKSEGVRIPISPPSASLAGLEVSPAHLLEDRIVQSQFSHFLEPPVLFFQFFELSGLIDPHSSILPSPPVIGLFRYPELAAHFTHCASEY